MISTTREIVTSILRASLRGVTNRAQTPREITRVPMRNSAPAEALPFPEELDPMRLVDDPDADLDLRADLAHALHVAVVRMSARASEIVDLAR